MYSQVPGWAVKDGIDRIEMKIIASENVLIGHIGLSEKVLQLSHLYKDKFLWSLPLCYLSKSDYLGRTLYELLNIPMPHKLSLHSYPKKILFYVLFL